jgi:hypothetical protein
LENVGVDSELLPVLEPPPPHAAMLVKQSNGSDLKILCVISILSKCPANDQIRVDAITYGLGLRLKRRIYLLLKYKNYLSMKMRLEYMAKR